jgi:hypothetical protein
MPGKDGDDPLLVRRVRYVPPAGETLAGNPDKRWPVSFSMSTRSKHTTDTVMAVANVMLWLGIGGLAVLVAFTI